MKGLVFSIVLVILGVLIGIISTFLLVNLRINFQKPFSINSLSFSEVGYEKASPSDFISENQIDIYSDKIIIWIKDASLAYYADTNSMDPVLDVEANGIDIVPKSEEDLHVGDIIVFEHGKDSIVHRIVEISQDKKGWYCITKGDNSETDDGIKVRFDMIEYKIVGVLY